MRIVLIGTGNVATILGRKMQAAGHTIIQVVGRASTHAKALGQLLQTSYTTSAGQVEPTADLYLIAVADAAIGTVAAALQLKNKLVVHTAGSVSRDVLKASSNRYGVLYPLQSLRKEMKQLPAIPFLVDASQEEDGILLYDFAKTLSAQVGLAGDEQRLKLHVAAVMVSNFTNHLYTLAAQYCQQEKADFTLLQPLISEVAERLQWIPPQQAQTGPAIRRDAPTIQKHLALLEPHGELKDLYAWFTQSIQRSHP